MSKFIILCGVSVLGFVGSYLPIILGADPLGLWPIVGGVIGGIFGIWAGYKINQVLQL